MRTVEEIVDAVELACGLPKGSLSDMSRRTRDVSLARHVACYVARRETKLSFATIARRVGLLDHKAVMYGFNRVSIALADNNFVIRLAVGRVAPEMLGRVVPEMLS